MIRIIDDVAYLGQPSKHFTVRAHDLGSGHMEISAVRRTEWQECEWTKQQIADHLEMIALHKEENALEIAAKALKIAANRAKTRVRRLCKAMGACTLLTLTYRFNELDLSRVKNDLKRFNDRMSRVFSDFRFVAAFERQKRGAWHMHLATGGLPSSVTKKNANGNAVRIKSFDVIRSIWRSVTGDRGGNIDVARRKRHSQSSPAAIARYLSKYITKEFSEGDKGVNRYAAYGDFALPPVIELGIVKNVLEAVEIAYSLIGDRLVFDQHYSRFGDWYYLHAEMSSDIKKPV